MRVIAGKQGGLALKAVPGRETRPTTDKVKEAIFNMIGPFFEGGACLDLYAGSGGLGIEALSRGMDTCVFVDQQKQAVATIHSNLQFLRLVEVSSVYRNEAKRALKALTKREACFGVIFLDPPYAKQELATLLSSIGSHGLLGQDGVVVCEHHAQVDLADAIAGLTKIRAEAYGDTGISLFQRV
ncbi:16S rRNA (guanine(966)-N(2))-methyltransferase RsmD [Shouchella shacheensis]|uniref:16S rRNA (guanine(966)-N(2))-methyltransferase RsmD n=1 Tax=Shouchella shacheensis TaxID=1649580 RepID=UPI00074028F0|nr:16S rRNA (guanine(966)-N(2))-methyltransferase RsmD [Shouchella shacheensis]